MSAHLRLRAQVARNQVEAEGESPTWSWCLCVEGKTLIENLKAWEVLVNAFIS